MTFSFNHLGNHGHLGNQMFQYAVLIGLGKKHNRQFCIPHPNVFGKHYYQELRSNIYDAFDIKCARGISRFPTVNEKSFEFDAEFFENPPKQDINILGFYQSAKWFAGAEDEVREAFTFKEKYRELANIMRSQLSGEVISLHVRRTDYIDNANHDCVTLDYYAKALEMMPKDLKVIIFTDDAEWAKAQPLFPDDRFFVSETNCPYTDMALMGLCDYHITANSSYSWWGAWLSSSKRVITPSVWFGPGLNHNTKDIYCDGWERI